MWLNYERMLSDARVQVEGPLMGRSRIGRYRDIDKMESVCRSVLVMLRAMDDAGIDVGQSIKEIEDAIGIG